MVNAIDQGRNPEPPFIGALLRAAWQAVRQRVLEGLAEAGYDDLHPAHLNVLQHPAPRGVAPKELAARAGMSKQAMNQLIGSMERLDYLERRDDPGRPGGRLVWLTERGEAAVTLIAETIVGLETEWAKRVGSRRFEEMKATLRRLPVD